MVNFQEKEIKREGCVDNIANVGLIGNQWIYSKTIQEAVKSVATVTIFATGIFTSALFAYRNPYYWSLTALSVSLLNLYLLPKILHHDNLSMIKCALITNVTVLGTIFLGGIGAFCCSLQPESNFFSNVVGYTFMWTTLLGYGVPFCLEGLKKGYSLLNHFNEWKEQILHLQTQFKFMPEVGSGSMIKVLFEGLLLQSALWFPEVVFKLCSALNFNPKEYVWAMIEASSHKEESLKQLEERIKGMEQIAFLADQQGDTIPQQMKNSHQMSLKMMFRSLKEEDHTQAISLLIQHGTKLIPQVLTTSQYLEHFMHPMVLQKTNAMIQEFLDQTVCWDSLYEQYLQLSKDLLVLEQDINHADLKTLSPEQKGNFFQRWESIQERFNTTRKEIEKIYLAKRMWKDFIPLWGDQDKLPFELEGGLLLVLQDPAYQAVDKAYSSMMGAGENLQQNLCKSLQCISSKLMSLNEDQEEPASAVMFLAANMGFIQKEYEKLREWLNLNSLNDLEEAMANIGLGKEEDLYNKNILVKQSQIPKEEICQKLHDYIHKAMPLHHQLNNHLLSKNQIDQKNKIYALMEKVTRTIFYGVTSGLILVPCLMYPLEGISGFMIGAAFFVLKHFGVPGTQQLTQLGNKFMQNTTIGKIMNNLLSRRVFVITPQRRDQANEFVKTDFFRRMRMLSAYAGLACLSICYRPNAIGFLKGMFVAKEVVNL